MFLWLILKRIKYFILKAIHVVTCLSYLSDGFRSDSSASILDTAYVTDKDDLEVIRNKTNMSSMSSSSSKNVTRTSRVSTSRHRSTNREVLIDDYYSTVEQLQRSNRDLSAKSKDQRCRTDLLVTQSGMFTNDRNIGNMTSHAIAHKQPKRLTVPTNYVVIKYVINGEACPLSVLIEKQRLLFSKFSTFFCCIPNTLWSPNTVQSARLI